MKLQKQHLALLLLGVLILQGCGRSNLRLDGLGDQTTGSNSGGVNEIDITTDQSGYCSPSVQGEHDSKYTYWAVVHTKVILKSDQIQWVDKDKTSTTYYIKFTQESPVSDSINPITPNNPQTVSIAASQRAQCLFSCEDAYDIQIPDAHNVLHSCLKPNPDPIQTIGVIVKP